MEFKKKRRFKSIIPVPDYMLDTDNRTYVKNDYVAIATDGTAWFGSPSNYTDITWSKLPNLPQDEE